jgi:hypothetical protein
MLRSADIGREEALWYIFACETGSYCAAAVVDDYGRIVES